MLSNKLAALALSPEILPVIRNRTRDYIRKGRTSDQQISVADLTGVAVQDISIASAVFRAYKR